MDIRRVAKELAERELLDLDRSIGDVLDSAGIGKVDPQGPLSDNVIAWEDYVLITSGRTNALIDPEDVAPRDPRAMVRGLRDREIVDLDRPLSEVLAMEVVGTVTPGGSVSDNVIAWEDYVLITSGKVQESALPSAGVDLATPIVEREGVVRRRIES